MLVFVDESGDSGFKIKAGSSAVFVVSLVIFDDNLEAEKASLAIKELRRKLKVSDSYEFKFNKCSKSFKIAFFEAIISFKYRVRAILVKKEVIRSLFLKTNTENFYNYIIMQVLKHSVGSIRAAKLKFDKRGEKKIRDQLRVYLSRQLDNKHKKIFIDLKLVDSKQNTLIQLADMVVGALASFYTGKDVKYLRILQKSRKIEDIWEFK